MLRAIFSTVERFLPDILLFSREGLSREKLSREGFAIPPGQIAEESVIPDDYPKSTDRDCKSIGYLSGLNCKFSPIIELQI